MPVRMSRSGPKPSNAQQRDAELTRVEAELKAAREQLEAVQAEISRSCRLLAGPPSAGAKAEPPS